jgi:hypothetical protein
LIANGKMSGTSWVVVPPAKNLGAGKNASVKRRSVVTV